MTESGVCVLSSRCDLNLLAKFGPLSCTLIHLMNDQATSLVSLQRKGCTTNLHWLFYFREQLFFSLPFCCDFSTLFNQERFTELKLSPTNSVFFSSFEFLLAQDLHTGKLIPREYSICHAAVWSI